MPSFAQKVTKYISHDEASMCTYYSYLSTLFKIGRGSPHVSNTLRLFDAPDDYQPKLTLFRDEAGWCPYCEKTILMIEEKRVPINIEVVPMVCVK